MKTKLISKLLLLIFLIVGVQLSARNKKNYNKVKTIEFGIETNLIPIKSNLDINKSAMNFRLSCGYYTNQNFKIGGFYNRMQDVFNKSETLVLFNDYVVDISNTSMNQFGLLMCYNIFPEGKFTISPELGIGYGILNFSSINSDLNPQLNYNSGMMTIEPRVNIGWNLSYASELGISAGYLTSIQLDNLNLDSYQVQGLNFGIYFKFALLRFERARRW